MALNIMLTHISYPRAVPSKGTGSVPPPLGFSDLSTILLMLIPAFDFPDFRTVDENEDLSYKFYNYWFVLCVIIIWIPTIMMIFGYTTIWLKLRQAFKAFPYLSQQSRIARSRRKVIQMLSVLIIIELICWTPWQIYILIEFILRHTTGDTLPDTGFLPVPEVIALLIYLQLGANTCYKLEN